MTRLWTDYLKEIDNPVKVTFKNGTAIKVEKDTQPTVKYGFDKYFDAYGDHFYCGKKPLFSVIDDTAFYNNKGLEVPYSLDDFLAMLCSESKTKENKDMLTIVNYKYDEKTATTTIFWSDKSQSSVTADSDAEANEFTGFCAACAKKLFGNKSTYLNQFDKWTVKIPARKKAEAEKKAAEDKAREEARAKRAAKKAERKAKRDIEIRAKQLADEYYAQEIEDEAEKIAHEKYGVPKNWFDGYSED